MSVSATEAMADAPNLETLWVRFKDHALEDEYRDAQRPNKRRQLRITILIVIVLNSAFALLDPFIFSEVRGPVMFFRLVVINGALLGLIGLSLLDYFYKNWPALLAIAALLITAFFTTINAIGQVSEGIVAGFTLVVLGIYVLLPFYFSHGLVAGILCSIIYVLATVFTLEISTLAFAALVMQLITANVIGAYALYVTERLRRLDFANLRTISAERARIRDLLFRILPPPVAERLESGERDIADSVDESVVLFADIVAFTDTAARFPAERVVEFLNDLFARFDELVARHGLEKIKTIGDAYMVAGGLPWHGFDPHLAAARLALAMRASVKDLKRPDGAPVEIRIGIAVGPLLGGVIGESRFLYDVWGDTVNLASRMESSGAPGAIQVTAAFRDHLAERFIFSPRGEVQVKGKGAMATYFLEGEAGASG